MSQNSKSYRKFIASAAAVAVVAPIAAPIASFAAETELSDIAGHRHEEAIRTLVAEGIIKGFPDGEFKPDLQIKRGDAAVMIARALGLLDGKNIPETELTDLGSVNEQTQEAIAKLEEKGIVSGYKDNTFKPNDHITRGEMAKIIAIAYELPLGDGETEFSDVSPKQTLAKYVDAIAEAGIAQGYENGNFGYADNIKRGDFAKFVYVAEGFEPVPEVTGVNAVNANTVNIEGSALQNLTKENFSLEGNTVSSFEVNEEGTSATLTLEGKVASGEEQTLVLTQEVEGEEVATELPFTYTLEINEVAVADVVVDDSTAGQTLTFTVNGEKADLDYLKESGYNVEFQSTNEIFAVLDEAGNETGKSLTSSTGQLSEDLTATKTGYGYKVVITDADDEVVAQSGLASVVVEDLNSQFASIDSFDLVAGDLPLENSTTALVGEDVVISNVTGTTKAGDDEQVITSYSVKSSNPAVAYVGAGNTIKPVKSGTTTITISAGETTKTFTLTVSADKARTASKVTAAPASTKLIAEEETATQKVDLTVVDQFGEAFTGNVFVELPTVKVDGQDANLVDFVQGSPTVAIENGKGSFEVTGTTAGKGNVVVKAKEDGASLATVAVDVTGDTEVSTRKLEIVDGGSEDLTIDSYAIGTGKQIVNDSVVKLAYNQYNEDGYYIGKEALKLAPPTSGAYTVQVNTKTDADVKVEGNEIVVTAGEKAGTVEIVISHGGTRVAKQTVTVNNSTPKIEELNFQSVATIAQPGVDVNAETVVSINEDTNLVSGIEVSTGEKVYFDEGTRSFYVEKDGTQGFAANADVKVGTLNWTADSGLDVNANTTYKTQAADSGNIIFTVTDAAGNLVDSISAKIDIPAAK